MASTRHDRDHPPITSSLQGYVGMVNMYRHTDLAYKQHRWLVALTAALGGRPEMSGCRGIRTQGVRLQVSLYSLSRVCLSYISDSCHFKQRRLPPYWDGSSRSSLPFFLPRVLSNLIFASLLLLITLEHASESPNLVISFLLHERRNRRLYSFF